MLITAEASKPKIMGAQVGKVTTESATSLPIHERARKKISVPHADRRKAASKLSGLNATSFEMMVT